jgi:hypothetical protein
VHFLEFYRPGERRIGESAGRFLGGALKADGIAIAIATKRSATGIAAQLARMGRDPIAAMQSGHFMLYESAEMLSRFEHDGVIDAAAFDSTVGAAVRAAHARAGERPLRAFGDMVGLLWDREEREAAVELERLWNGLQSELGFPLFCSYAIDVFSEHFSEDALHGVFDTHTHLCPTAGSAEIGRVLEQAIDEVLGADAAADVRSRMRARRSGLSMPKPEQMILWVRSHLPQFAGKILNRARELYDVTAPRVYLREEHSST